MPSNYLENKYQGRCFWIEDLRRLFGFRRKWIGCRSVSRCCFCFSRIRILETGNASVRCSLGDVNFRSGRFVLLRVFVAVLEAVSPVEDTSHEGMAGVLNDLIGRQVEPPIYRRVQRVNDDGSFLVLPPTTISTHLKKKGMLPMST